MSIDSIVEKLNLTLTTICSQTSLYMRKINPNQFKALLVGYSATFFFFFF